MYAAAFDSDSRAVRTLLAGRADPIIQDKFGYNVLHYASLQGNRKVFELVSVINV
jgi:ankyrin repeat protein